MTISRIKYEGQTIKAFDGRKKVAEVSLEEESKAIFNGVWESLVEEFEADEWVQDGNQWKDETGDTNIQMDEAQFVSYIGDLVSDATAELGDEALADDGEEEEEERKGLNIPEKYRAAYGPGQNCGDELIQAMDDAGVSDEIKGRRYLDMDKLYAIAAENGITPKGANNGHIKMNVANMLRGKLRRGEDVTILGKPLVIAAEPAKKAAK